MAPARSVRTKQAAKLDLGKQYPDYFRATQKPALITLPPLRYLAIDGEGEPGAEAFQEAVGALYSMAFTIKMARKFAGHDYKVSALEGLWSIPGGFAPDAYTSAVRAAMRWRLLILVPEFVSAADLKAAMATLQSRGNPRVRDVKIVRIDEGLCMQTMHVGPYSSEPATLALMSDAMKERGLKPRGRHHEIYLSDPRRVAPERQRTILRQSVSPARRG